MAALLTLTWTGGTVLIRRRWAPAYAGARDRRHRARCSRASPALAVRRGHGRGDDAWRVALALRVPPADPAAAAGRSAGAPSAATMIGAGLGALLVADPTVDWTVGAVPALALLPSTVASFWGGYHLWRFQQVDPARAVRRARGGPGHAQPGLAGRCGCCSAPRAGSSRPPPRCPWCSW